MSERPPLVGVLPLVGEPLLVVVLLLVGVSLLVVVLLLVGVSLLVGVTLLMALPLGLSALRSWVAVAVSRLGLLEFRRCS